MTDLTLPETIDEQADSYKQAAESLAAAQRMKPMLEGFIRTISRNPKMRVLFDGRGSRTDGKTVWLTPPGELGKYRVHDRHECTVHDEFGLPVCNACRVEEDFFSTAVHECAHQVHKSTIDVNISHVRGLRTPWIEGRVKQIMEAAAGTPYSSSKAEIWAQDDWEDFVSRIDKNPEMGYMGLGARISPWLPNLINAFEDARVNAKMFDYRPGVTRMFVSSTKKLITEGYVSMTGELIHWGDQDLDAQITIAALLRASGYDFDYSDSLDPEAIKVWDDTVLAPIVDGVCDLASIEAVFDSAYAALKRLQELGYLLDQAEGESPGDGGDGDGDGEEQDGPSGSGGFSKGSDDTESGDGGDSGGGQDEAGEDGAAGATEGADEGQDGADDSAPLEQPSPSDEARDRAREGQALLVVFTGHATDVDETLAARGDNTDAKDPTEVKPQLGDDVEWSAPDDGIEVAVVHAEHFDAAAEGIGKVNVFKFTDKRRWDDSYCVEVQDKYRHGTPSASSNVDNLDEVTTMAVHTLPRIRKIFTVNRAVRTTKNMKVGRVDSGSVGRKLKTGRVDVFKKREIPNVRSYKVVIGLDISGSTSNATAGSYSKYILSAMKAAAFAQAEMLHRVGIPFAFFAHTGSFAWSHATSGSRCNLNLIEVKGWNDKWGPETKRRLAAVEPCASNLDGHTMEFYRKQLESRPEDLGLILYYTDGAMPAENYTEELEVLQREVKTIKRRKDIDVLAIGVGNTEPEGYGLDTVYYGGTQHLPDVVKGLEQKITGLR